MKHFEACRSFQIPTQAFRSLSKPFEACEIAESRKSESDLKNSKESNNKNLKIEDLKVVLEKLHRRPTMDIPQ